MRDAAAVPNTIALVGDGSKHLDAHTLQWRPDAPCTVDVIAFEQRLAAATPAVGPAEERQALAKAVDLCGGDLLPGCYEDWVLSERQRLSEAFAGALERLAELLMGSRQHTNRK